MSSPSRIVMTPCDILGRPWVGRLTVQWERAVEWLLQIVFVAREALQGGRLVIGGSPLGPADFPYLPHRHPVPEEFILACVREGFLVEDADGLRVARFAEDWYRPPSKLPDAEAQRSRLRRSTASDRTATAERPQADRTTTEERPQATAGDRSMTAGDRIRPPRPHTTVTSTVTSTSTGSSSSTVTPTDPAGAADKRPLEEKSSLSLRDDEGLRPSGAVSPTNKAATHGETGPVPPAGPGAVEAVEDKPALVPWVLKKFRGLLRGDAAFNSNGVLSWLTGAQRTVGDEAIRWAVCAVCRHANWHHQHVEPIQMPVNWCLKTIGQHLAAAADQALANRARAAKGLEGVAYTWRPPESEPRGPDGMTPLERDKALRREEMTHAART